MNENMDDQDYKTEASKKPLSPIGELFGGAWQVYKERFWTLVGIMAIPVLAWLLIGGIGVGIGLLSSLFGGASIVVIVLFSVIAIALAILLTFWPQAALIYAVKERSRRIGIKESFVKAWHTLSSFIWVSALTSLAIAGGFLLLIVPGFIFAVWFLFAAYILIAEGVKGSAALSKSRELVRGRWWSIFGRMILLGLVAGGIGFIIALIPIVGQLIVNLLITPFSIVFLYLLYEDLKRVKGEGQTETRQRPPRSDQKGISTKVIIGLAILGLIALAGIPTAVTLISLRGARTKARDARITSEMGQLRVKMELVSSKEGGYNELSCSYDAEIQSLCDDIDTQCTQGTCAGDDAQGGPEDVTIHSSEKDYCAYTPLNEGEYYCIDSSGVSGKVSDPSTTCKRDSFKCPSGVSF